MTGNAKKICGDFHGAAHKPFTSTIKNYAFAPDELEIGSIVYAHMKRVLPHYAKDRDDARPMLVTGLWRNGDSIEKIELMKFTGSMPVKEYPCVFGLDTSDIFSSGESRYSYLRTDAVYLFDNEERIFPRRSNPDTVRMDGRLWEDILVRRAQAIIFNPNTKFEGNTDTSLEREGISFSTIPHSAIRGTAFIPEVEGEGISSRPWDIIPPKLADEIASFAVRYEAKMQRQNGHGFYTFPPYEDWPINLPLAEFPLWRNPLLLRGLEPDLP